MRCAGDRIRLLLFVRELDLNAVLLIVERMTWDRPGVLDDCLLTWIQVLIEDRARADLHPGSKRFANAHEVVFYSGWFGRIVVERAVLYRHVNLTKTYRLTHLHLVTPFPRAAPYHTFLNRAVAVYTIDSSFHTRSCSIVTCLVNP